MVGLKLNHISKSVHWLETDRDGLTCDNKRKSSQNIKQLHRVFEMVGVLTLYVLNFYRGNVNIYLHFVSFLHIDAMQEVEILLQIRQRPTYST